MRMMVLRQAGRLRAVLPQTTRQRLYDWHPGRARRWRRYPGIERTQPGGFAVLTFDDGPDEDATPLVLDALDQVGARATFFVLARQLDAHLEIGREILLRGHEIGLHGYGHERQDRIGFEHSRQDVVSGFDAIDAALGVRCRWYRPPFGKMSAGSLEACRIVGMTPVYWSAWGLDWEPVDAERIAETVCEQIDDGGILLLHDSALHAPRAGARPTAQAIPLIAERARDKGITFVPLGEAIAASSEVDPLCADQPSGATPHRTPGARADQAALAGEEALS